MGIVPVTATKSQEAKPDERVAKGDYLHLYPPRYKFPIRAVFTAPHGWNIVSVDYKAVELAVLAWQSQDPNMIEHIRRTMLPDDHPEFFDIHANRAVRAFKLDCPPTKRGLKEIGKPGLRVAAKNVNFGIPYGRSAPAIARQCAEEGVDVTVDECQAMIDDYYREYPEVKNYLERCRQRVIDPGWLCTPFHGYRRFYPTDDRSVLSAMQREAQNFTIQSSVADLVNNAVHTIRVERKRLGLRFRLLLQIHDALMFEVPDEELSYFQGEDAAIVDWMSRQQPFYPADLDGNRLPGVGPYFFGVDVSVGRYWADD